MSIGVGGTCGIAAADGLRESGAGSPAAEVAGSCGGCGGCEGCWSAGESAELNGASGGVA